MKLVVFDIDGTLTDTNKMDGICFKKALEKVLKRADGIPKDLIDSIEFQTDTGMTVQIWDHFKARFPRTFEINAIKSELISEFEYFHKEIEKTSEINGAKLLFESLKSNDDIALAIATGSWKPSAEYKLDIVDIRWRYVPLITAEGLLTKYDILKESRNHSRVFYNKQNFDLEVYVGDRDWDEAAALKLGMKFIRIDKNADKTTENILKSFPYADTFIEILENL